MKREFAVGVFFLMAVAALAYMVSRLTQDRDLLRGAKTYYALVNDSSGLLPGAAVKVAGIDVGRLNSKSIKNSKALLTIEVSPDLAIHQDASVTLKSLGYLGDRYLNLNPGTENLPLISAGATLPADESATIEGLVEKSETFVETWTGVGDSLRSLLGG